MIDTTGVNPDVWSDWLLHRRHGDDPAFAKVVRAEVSRFVDRVLDAAQLAPGMRLADIGTGEGVIALRAVERTGPTLSVVLTDVSRAMLRHAESCALERGVHRQQNDPELRMLLPEICSPAEALRIAGKLQAMSEPERLQLNF